MSLGTVPILNAGAMLLMLGFILYIGVIGSYIFERYRIPDVMNLMLIGVILGPVFHLIDPALLKVWMPVVGAIALSLILFEGGLGLELGHIIERFRIAFVLATVTFVGSAALIAIAYRGIMGAPWVICLMLGSTLGCVSSAVILPISNLVTAPNKVKTTIHLEAALSDMWGVVMTLVLIRLAHTPQAAVDPGYAVSAIWAAFTMAIVGAGVFGMVWLWLLDRFRESSFDYMMTLAAVFVLYGITELMHGSGPMAALTFGAVLTNARGIAKLFGRTFKFKIGPKILEFNTEVTFFARTFFFVYLGLVFSFDAFNFSFWAMLGVAMVAILAVRWLVAKGVSLTFPREREYERLYMAMVPRGLTSAVLVGTVQARVPGTDDFLAHAFAVILLTNAIMTWWVWRHENPPDLSVATAQNNKPNGKKA
jgi:cell volume regulation protein A